MKILTKRIEEMADVIAGQSPPSTTYNKLGKGMPFFQGKADYGAKYPTVNNWCTKPKKIALANDILISVRAPVGPVNICNVEACIGRGLSAIRVNLGYSHKYIYYYLKSNEKRISKLGVGSTFSAITQKEIKKFKIPIPEKYEDQIRIATLLSHVEELIAKRKESIRLLDELLKSTFWEMFGDPIKNEKGWDKKPLSKFGTLDRGISKHRPRNAPKLLGGPHPLIQTSDVANAGLYIKFYNQTYSENGLKQSKMWPKGTLCITIAANIAKTSILNFDACFPDSVVGFTSFPEKSDPIYVHFVFKFFQRILEKNAPQAAQKNINLGILRNLSVPKPDIKEQNKFVEKVKKVESLRTKYEASLQELENLYGALSQRAFRGALDLSGIPVDLSAKAEIDTPHETTFPVLEVKCKAKMKVADKEQNQLAKALKQIIKKKFQTSFTFNELWDEFTEQFPIDTDTIKFESEAQNAEFRQYETIKSIVFEWLEAKKPFLSQVFDEKRKEMVLKPAI